MSITRRDFIAGLGVALAATTHDRLQAAGTHIPVTPYPPSLTGLRGNHPGSFESAHRLAFGAWSAGSAQNIDDDEYDLIVVGGGISGLATAYFWRQHAGEHAKILILDNHDDFGGHAKRNEFTVDGKKLIAYGGSQSIEAPSHYSQVAKQLLVDLGIDVEKFYQYYDQDFTQRHQLSSHWYLDATHFGSDHLVPNPLGALWLGVTPPEDIRSVIIQLPLSQRSQEKLITLLTDPTDWLAGKSLDEKWDYLRSKSYEQYLRDDLAMPDDVILLLRQRAHGLWAVGYDALSGLAAARSGEPGTRTLGLEQMLWGDEVDEPYIFHFPDGNATIARLLVEQLNPHAISADSMEASVNARVNYAALDTPQQHTRIRLNSTALNVRHNSTKTAVEVTYEKQEQIKTVVGSKVVLACYNHVIPFLCPDLPTAQAEALAWPEKAPLVYTNVALRNWRAFKSAGLYHFEAPRDFWAYGSLDFPVSIPGYSFSSQPEEPIVLHLVHVPTSPGLDARSQYREGRRTLMSTSFEDYEHTLRKQLEGMLKDHDFNFDRDVAGITVNRWPHGYAYEYIDLWDPPDWGPDKGPHITARQPFGRIAIANSDSSAYAYVNGAIDAAWRSVNELLSVDSKVT